MAKPKTKTTLCPGALAAFAVTLAALFVLLLAAYALPGSRCGTMSTNPR